MDKLLVLFLLFETRYSSPSPGSLEHSVLCFYTPTLELEMNYILSITNPQNMGKAHLSFHIVKLMKVVIV